MGSVGSSPGQGSAMRFAHLAHALEARPAGIRHRQRKHRATRSASSRALVLSGLLIRFPLASSGFAAVQRDPDLRRPSPGHGRI